MSRRAQVEELERTLREATKSAFTGMQGAADRAARQVLLKQWETVVSQEIRPAIITLQAARYYLDDDSAARVGKLTKTLVVDRAALEGMVDGEGPKKHMAGRAFYPPSKCAPELIAQAREVVELGVALAREELTRTDAHEQARRDNVIVILDEALADAHSLLERSGSEYRAFYASLEDEVRAFHSAVGVGKAVGAVEAAEAHREKLAALAAQKQPADPFERACQNLRAQLRGRLDSLSHKGRLDPHGLQQLRDESVSWGRRLVSQTAEQMRREGHEKNVEDLLPRFVDALDAWVSAQARRAAEERRPAPSPAFELIKLADLDPRVQKPDCGIHLTFWPNGHLRRASLGQDAVLEVSRDRPRARYEDSANVSEYRADGVIDSYGGRYEREERARVSFATWVKDRVREMLDWHDFG